MISGTPAPGLVLLYTSHIRNLSAVSRQQPAIRRIWPVQDLSMSMIPKSWQLNA